MKYSISLLALLALLASPLMEQAGLVEAAADHHEHDGISDADTGEEGHRHGDADDHHDTPDSPCHHHVVHCCCAHSHSFVSENVPGLLAGRRSTRISIPIFQDELPPLPQSIFHVPLA